MKYFEYRAYISKDIVQIQQRCSSNKDMYNAKKEKEFIKGND